MMVPTSYEGSDNDDKVEMVHEINQNNNNYYYAVHDYENSDKVKENLIDENIDDEVDKNPKTTVMIKVVWTIKKLQTSCNKDANKLSRKQLKRKVQKKI